MRGIDESHVNLHLGDECWEHKMIYIYNTYRPSPAAFADEVYYYFTQ